MPIQKINPDTFCMAPWMSMYLGPDGEAMPCCVADWTKPLGQIKSRNDAIQVFNNAEFRKLREQLATGIKAETCSHCWKFEDMHTEDRSLRHGFNRKHPDLIDELLQNTNDDYSLKEIKFYYLDVRFDNICNLKCRTCGSHFSSMWKSDEIKLGWDKYQPITFFSNQKVKEAVGDKDLLEFILEQLPHVREIYFAGGEPLMNDGHYTILQRLIDLGRQNEVEIRYNTNFSKLKFKNHDVIPYWKQFKHVVVGASLDANHARGEYMRKNLIWQDAIDNMKRVRAEVPHVNVHISATISIMNAYNIVDFHREWIDLGLIDPSGLVLNPLFGPDCYRLSNLPDHHKVVIKKLYEDHIAWLEGQESNCSNLYIYNWVKDGFRGLIDLLMKPQQANWVQEWQNRNNRIDDIRHEDFFDIFPEYADLKDLLKPQ